MKKIILLISLALIITSCDDHQPPTFGGEQTFVYFSELQRNLDVVIDDTGTLEVQINTTTLSDQDRTVQLELLEDSNALPENYEIPSLAVTIPAGEYFGSFVINGIDNSVEISPRLLFFRIVSAGSDAVISEEELEVSIRQICPIEDGFFTGPYLLEQVTPVHPANGTESLPTGVVDLFENGGSTERAFQSDWISFGNAQTYPLDFSCNDVIMTDIVDTNLVCVQGNPSITLGPAPTTGSYDTLDDSSFTFIMAEYLENGGCSVPDPLITEFQLTKQ